ncbi:hypothetical protein GALL_248360 [mine drainage metagenome]|uniref:Uncharacterized protein n=1 Tax=mine drainage metagenome TaxID=410659 RepID=A0A1J5RYM1_9ZZZZ
MLTQQQIDDIAFYCYTRNVEYYDVQLELVDHIADIIEDLQKANPALSFSEALELAGKQFSDDEFSAIVKSKKEQLLLRFKKLWQKEFISYFTIPKITITMCLVAFVIWALQHKNLEKLPMPLLQIFNFLTVYRYSFGRSKIIKLNKEDKTLPLVVTAMLEKRNKLLIIPMSVYIFLMFRQMFELSPYPKIFYEIGLYFFPLFILIALAWTKVYVDQNILLREKYPKAFV